MEYSRLCEFYERLESTSKRLEMVSILVDLIRECTDEEVAIVLYLTQGKIAPDFQGIELGVAEKLLVRTLSQSTGVRPEEVERLYHEVGDLGNVTESLLEKGGGVRRQLRLGMVEGGSKGPPSVLEVHSLFTQIALCSGPGSQSRKLELVEELLFRLDPRSARYMVRTVTGKLRLGVADMTLLDALAEAHASREVRVEIERAYNITSDLGKVARVLRREGLEGLRRLSVQVGVPVRAMLAERLNDPREILEKMGGEAAVEPKYDGLRIQVHLLPGSGEVLYTRRLERVTEQFPDITAQVRRAFSGSSTIVEGEVVAIDRRTGSMLPFQEVAPRRGRKHEIDRMVEEVPVAIYLFDCLLVDGEDLTSYPLPKRRKALEEAFPHVDPQKAGPDDRVRLSEHTVVRSPQELEREFERAVSEGAEGVMVKSLGPESLYRAGARGWVWIKYKREYRAELADSLDLVVVGAFFGRGRRAGGFGALLLAAYNREEGVFETLCKVGTGFDDETLESLPEILRPHIRETPPSRVRSEIQPDVWVEPSWVLEVRGSELTLSPVHTALLGVIKEGYGVALRFPRFTGRWRSDKAPEDSTTTEEVLHMFRNQRRTESAGGEEPGE